MSERRWTIAVVAAALLAAVPDASAQIYTRRKSNGVIEATNVPSSRDFRLTYPGKGRLIHSFGFRGNYSGQYDRHIEDAASTSTMAAMIAARHATGRNVAVGSEHAHSALEKGARMLGMELRKVPADDEFRMRVDGLDARQNIRRCGYPRAAGPFGGDVDLALAGANAGENASCATAGCLPQGDLRATRRGSRPRSPASSAWDLGASFLRRRRCARRKGGGPPSSRSPAGYCSGRTSPASSTSLVPPRRGRRLQHDPRLD